MSLFDDMSLCVNDWDTIVEFVYLVVRIYLEMHGRDFAFCPES